MPSSTGCSQPGTEPASLTFPALAGGFFTTSAAGEAPVSWYKESSLVPHAPCPTRVHKGPALSSLSGSQADEGPALLSCTLCVRSGLPPHGWGREFGELCVGSPRLSSEAVRLVIPAHISLARTSHMAPRLSSEACASSSLLTSHWPGPVTWPHPSARELGNVSERIHFSECVSVSSTRSSASSCHLPALKKSS